MQHKGSQVHRIIATAYKQKDMVPRPIRLHITCIVRNSAHMIRIVTNGNHNGG